MCTTFERGKKTITSPSVWPGAKCSARMSSPFTCTVSAWSKVRTGSASVGAGGNHVAGHARAARGQPAPHVVVGDDGGVAREQGVTAGVVEVPVGVEDEAERLVGGPPDRRRDLGSER